MASEDSGLGHADPVPPAANGPRARHGQPVGTIPSRRQQDGLPTGGAGLDKTDGNRETAPETAPETTSETYGRCATTTTRRASPRSTEVQGAVDDKLEKDETSEKDDPVIAAKRQEIRDASVQGDFPRLQQLAGSEGGFLTDELRQIACKASVDLLFCYIASLRLFFSLFC